MPKLRINSRPLLKCPYYSCDNYFRKFYRRKFCSDACRRNSWASTHEDYARAKRKRWEANLKLERRARRKYVWVVEGESTAPVRLQIEEALAQASPETIAEIKELLPRLEVQDD